MSDISASVIFALGLPRVRPWDRIRCLGYVNVFGSQRTAPRVSVSRSQPASLETVRSPVRGARAPLFGQGIMRPQDLVQMPG